VRTVTENDATWGEVARNDEELRERERERDSHVASHESKRPFKRAPPKHVLNELGLLASERQKRIRVFDVFRLFPAS